MFGIVLMFPGIFWICPGDDVSRDFQDVPRDFLDVSGDFMDLSWDFVIL